VVIGVIDVVPVAVTDTEEARVELIQDRRVHGLEHPGTSTPAAHLDANGESRTKTLLVVDVQARLHVAPTLLSGFREAPLVTKEHEFCEVVNRYKRHPVLAELFGHEQPTRDRELVNEKNELSVAVVPISGAESAPGVDLFAGAVVHLSRIFRLPAPGSEYTSKSSSV